MSIDHSQAGNLAFGDRLVYRSDDFFRGLLWLLAGYGFIVWAIALVDRVTHPLALTPWTVNSSPLFGMFALLVGAPVSAFLGGLVLKRQRQNLVGLLLLVWAGGFASFGISTEISPALYGLVALPIAAWWTSLILTPFYFPDGHAYPRWLSPVLPTFFILAFLQGGIAIVSPERLPYPGTPANPFLVSGAEVLSEVMTKVYTIFVVPVIIGVFLSPLLRYRRANAVQRQQIKAFAWSTMVLAPYLVFFFAVTSTYPEFSEAPPVLQAIGAALVGGIGLFPPAIIAYSILRYKLFDIDIIIRKTLQYTVITALLSIIYFGSVFLLQRLFSSLTGQQSPLVLVVSTLLIAALFAPLRRRIQDGIDRRFYRQKYDAQQVVAQFARTARDETDLNALIAELERTIQETLQPEGVRVWLKPAPSHRAGIDAEGSSSQR